MNLHRSQVRAGENGQVVLLLQTQLKKNDRNPTKHVSTEGFQSYETNGEGTSLPD